MSMLMGESYGSETLKSLLAQVPELSILSDEQLADALPMFKVRPAKLA